MTKTKYKKNIILDLDQTLIAAEPYEDLERLKMGEKEKFESLKRKIKHHNMDDIYIVFERPHLQKFLDYLFKNFNVSIWTAASKDYACFIIDNIVLQDKNRKLDYIFFSYHCDISKKKKKRAQKSLELLWDIFKLPEYNKENTIIIDDYDHVHKTQPENCILVKPFNVLNEEYFEVEENANEDNYFRDNIIPRLKQKHSFDDEYR